jgi:hypothetical protein
LRRDPDFSDVTQQIEAHKIILTAGSPFFRRVLKGNKHSHPMIYMRGLKAKELEAIVDFMYLGEANVCQEDLEAFLTLGVELQLKGLTGTVNKTVASEEEPKATLPKKERRVNTTHKPHVDQHNREDEDLTNPIVPVNDEAVSEGSPEGRVAADAAKSCSECEKMFSQAGARARHVKTIHRGERPFSCGEAACGQVFGARQHLQLHRRRWHHKDKSISSATQAKGAALSLNQTR